MKNFFVGASACHAGGRELRDFPQTFPNQDESQRTKTNLNGL
jgi:hypothetical protein